MSTEIKTIKGFAGGKRTGYMPEKKNVTVRFTSDEYGETMSIEDGEIMLGVPFEPIKKMIEKARKK
jgi:hypothetical protein